MSSFGPDIRAALAATRLADAAPPAIRRRGRKRLMSALAAGTVSTSVAIAQGASLAGSGATITTGTLGGGWLSLTGTLVSSSLIGLSLGLMAITPTSRITENPSAVVVPHPVPSVPAALHRDAKSRPIELAVSRALPAKAESTPRAPTAMLLPEEEQRAVLPRRSPSPVSIPQPAQPFAVTPELKTSDALSAPPNPVKASIARELELIGEVRRALINGRAGLALVALDRHADEFPNGALAEEATASRVIALCALGRIDEGQRWFATFRSRYPNSPQVKRLQSACPERANSQDNSGHTIP